MSVVEWLPPDSSFNLCSISSALSRKENDRDYHEEIAAHRPDDGDGRVVFVPNAAAQRPRFRLFPIRQTARCFQWPFETHGFAGPQLAIANPRNANSRPRALGQ